MTACRRWTSVHTTARGLDRGTCSLHVWTQALWQARRTLCRKLRVYLVDPWTARGDSDHRYLDPVHCLKEFFRRHAQNLFWTPIVAGGSKEVVGEVRLKGLPLLSCGTVSTQGIHELKRSTNQ